MQIRKGNVHAVAGILAVKCLTELYPQRTVFHISEQLAWFGAWGMYFITKGRFSLAVRCEQELNRWDEGASESIGLRDLIVQNPLAIWTMAQFFDGLKSDHAEENMLTRRDGFEYSF